MDPGASLVLGVCIILVVFVIAAYIWYYKMGWEPFHFAGTVPYAVGAACNANPSPGDTKCPSGKTCCPSGQRCFGSQCATPCTSDSHCPAGQECTGGVCQTGRAPSWTAAGDSTMASIRFKDCTFTVTTPLGQKHSVNVTAVLNGMAVGFRGATTPVPRTLRLDRPLNAFSFIIAGVNDSDAVTTAAEAATWKNCPSALTGLWRTI